MTTKNKKPASYQEVIGAVIDTLGEIEKLAKSAIDKEDEDKEAPAPSPEAPAPAPEGEAPAPAPAPEGEAPAPHDEAKEDPMADMAAHMASMSDEDLQKLIDTFVAEMEKRKSAAAGAAPMDKNYDMLMKSIGALAKQVEKLEQKLEKSIAAPAPVAKPTVNLKTQMPASNSSEVVVREKNPPMAEKLAKSDVSKFLLNEQRNGNLKVNSGLLAKVARCRTDEEVAAIVQHIQTLGLKIPEKK
jgi:hypothetical protein